MIAERKNARVLARVLKTEKLKFPNVFECLRVLNLAINAHEIICFQSLNRSVRAEVKLGHFELGCHRATERDHKQIRSVAGLCNHNVFVISSSPQPLPPFLSKRKDQRPLLLHSRGRE